MAIMLDIMRPSIVTKVISRIRTPGTPLADFLGIGIGGRNVEQLTVPTRVYTYDIFDYVRTVSNARMPGAPAGTVKVNPVGNNTVALARNAEKIPLDYNLVAAIRTLGENAGVIDRRGKRYIEVQARELHRRQSNLRELMAGSLFRGGKYYLFAAGDDLVPSYTSTGAWITVDLKMDANYQLIGASFAAGMPMDTGSNCITATWAGGNTILTQLQAIDAGFQQGVGAPLAHVFCNYTVWNNVLQDTGIKTLAGTANQPFAQWFKESLKAPDGTDLGVQVGRIKGMEWIQWHIANHGLNIYSGTGAYDNTAYTKIFPDNYALFSIEPGTGDGDGWLRMIEGCEIIKRNDMAEPEEAVGFVGWMMEKADPARVELHTTQSIGIELNVPKSVAVARVQ
jgi:Phage major capsid protein E